MNTKEQQLRELEITYIKGQEALKQRNALVLEMLEEGHSQADLYRRINDARSEVGAKSITREAVFMLAYRNRRKKVA